MKLLYEMPGRDALAFETASRGEKAMYCVPFNIQGDKFVEGYIAVTSKRIYKILDGAVLAEYPLEGSANFRTETMYGSGGFYANISGSSTLICRFIVGRHLARYAVIARACEMFAERGSAASLANDTPERFCPECGRPFLRGSQVCPFCMKKGVIYKKLWGMTKGLRLMMFFPFIVATVGITVSFILPVIQRHITDDYLKVSPLPSNLPIGFLILIGTLIIIDMFNRALGVVEARLLAIASGKFQIMLRTLLYEKIQALSLSSIQQRSTGDLMQRVSNDTNIIQNFVIRDFPNLYKQLISLPLAVIMLFWMDWTVAVFVLVPIPIALFVLMRFWNFVYGVNVKTWLAGARENYLLQDVLNGVRVVKSFGQENYEVERFGKVSNAYAKQSLRQVNMWTTMWPFITKIINISVYFIRWYVGLRVFNNIMTYGRMTQLMSYAQIVYNPLVMLTNIPNSLANFLASTGKVFEILEEHPEVSDIALPLDIRIEGDISVRDVSFGYQSYDPVLENISLDINKGEMVGIVGHSGSGKTTLINLLMRLYDVNEGGIYIDDVNLKDISQHALRSQIGVVLQETFLFTGTIRDNIRYSKPYATNEEVIEAARTANAHDFIVNLPEGYNTYVGEKGYSLSGGERQRVAIARAVIHDPRILILDEATASLDTETEKLIQDALNKLAQNRTTIAIAHRLSTLRDANRILVLDKGKMAEYGTHAELLEKRGIYYRLVMAQREMAQGIAGEADDIA